MTTTPSQSKWMKFLYCTFMKCSCWGSQFGSGPHQLRAPHGVQQDEDAVIGLSFSWWTGEWMGTELNTEVGKAKHEPSKLLPKVSSSAKKEAASLLHEVTGGLGVEDKISDSYCSNWPMKPKFGEMRLRRCLM